MHHRFMRNVKCIYNVLIMSQSVNFDARHPELQEFHVSFIFAARGRLRSSYLFYDSVIREKFIASVRMLFL